MYLFEQHSIVNEDNEILNLMDQKIFPVIPNGSLEDIFLMDNFNDDNREKRFKTYSFNGMGVPRVSEILKTCISKEYLTIWASKIGFESYKEERHKALTIGSMVHKLIDNFLLYSGDDTEIEFPFNIPKKYYPLIMTSYNNFKAWIYHLNSLGYYIEEVVGLEIPIVCPWYGGTIDGIVKINGKYYIIDFKTSKKIIWEYIVQVCAYMWAVNNGYAQNLPHINGVGIIRVDKEKDNCFDDIFLNEDIPYQREILEQYFIGFGALLNCFYNSINMQQYYNSYHKIYDIEKVITK